MVALRLFVEGGGDSKALKSRCREGFRKLLAHAGCEGRMPRIVACGGRQNAFESYLTAVAEGGATLLVDAEGPVETPDPWEHVQERDGWRRPDRAEPDDLHFMVQLMESWFLADPEGMARFFGDGFRSGRLPQRRAVEEVRKEDVADGIEAATRESRRGVYHKGRHSFDLLGRLDSQKLEIRAPWARRFFERMRGD